MDGIEGQMLPSGERFYLGLAVTMLDVKEAIPFLIPTASGCSNTTFPAPSPASSPRINRSWAS